MKTQPVKRSHATASGSKRPAQPTQRFLIADDHAVVRRGLRQILVNDFPTATFGEAETAQAALELVWKEDWSLVLLDLSMPGRSGLDILKDLKQARPDMPVLMLSMFAEDQFALRALRSGASGYITKDSAPAELSRAVQRTLAGGKYVSAQLAERMAALLGSDQPRAPHENLSDREFQVFRFIASGKAGKEIAAELSLSVKTVSTYRTRILEKMHLHTNAELMRYALQHALVD